MTAGDDAVAPAGIVDPAKLLGQTFQIFKFVLHVFSMLGGDLFHLFAGICLLRSQTQQVPNLIESESQITATANEAETLQRVVAVGAIIALGPQGQRHQVYLLIVANGNDLHARFPGED